MDFDFNQVDVLIYDKDCDGSCCRFLIEHKYTLAGRDQPEYVDWNPSHELEDDELEIFRDKNVLMVDLSPKNQETADGILGVAAKFLCLDHHKSAIKLYEGQDWYHADVEECGATLLWVCMSGNNEPPILAQYVKDRDLWQWKLENSHEINAVIQTTDYEYSRWLELYKDLESAIHRESVIQRGVTILQIQNRIADELAGYARLVDLYTTPAKDETIRARIVNCPFRELISMTGHKILDLEPEKPEPCDVAVMYSLFPDGGILCSVRTTDSVDAAVLCTGLGGGGHAKAAGFRAKFKDGLPWVAIPEPQFMPVDAG